MKYIANIDPATLLDKPIWQMSGREFCALTNYANAMNEALSAPASRHLCRGVRALATHLACSESKIYALRRDGVLDDAVVSRIGKAIVFDGEKARMLAVNNKK